MNDFNQIANKYDSLARFFFGKSIRKCQTSFLHLIPDASRILILGGGTGWIIDEVKRRSTNCKIWYVDQSSRMISLASSTPNSLDVVFIHGSINNIPEDLMFDVIITNFFLDLFTDASLHKVLCEIKVLLEPEGIWLVSDFVNNHRWHSWYLFVMYCFFRLTSGIETDRLPGWEESMMDNGFVATEHEFLYSGFMKSVVYKRTTSF